MQGFEGLSQQINHLALEMHRLNTAFYTRERQFADEIIFAMWPLGRSCDIMVIGIQNLNQRQL